MRRLALLLATLLLLTACGGNDPAAEPTPTPTEATPTPAPPEATPTPAPQPTATPTPAEPTPTETGPTEEPGGNGATTSTAYLVREHESGLWVEPVTGDHDPTVGVARAAMELMVRGEAADPNLTTLAGPGVEVLGADIDGDTLIVDLSGALRNNRTGSAGEAAFAQQLAYTGAQFDGIERVRLLVDGAEVSDLWGHLDWSEPIEPEPFALSPITFDSHTWGEQVPVGDVTVGGEANTFEANVQLRLLGPNGDVIEETFTTATSGSGERGRWEHTFFLEGAATWTIEASESDPSGGEGRPPFSTTLELRSS